jgi:ABC-type phosphate/phosphonate transport system substrate-binding protein
MKFILRTAPVLAALAACCLPAAPADAGGGKDVKIGLVKSLFRDKEESSIKGLTTAFGDLMKEATGLTGSMQVLGDAFDVAKQLQDGKVQLGVFHGYEFAWAKQKYPDLKPLCIAINQDRNLSAHLMVKFDSDIKDFAQLKGKVFALPNHTQAHSQLFVEREVQKAGGDSPDKFFGKVMKHRHVEAALDDVVRGKVQAALADGTALEGYKSLKPGAYSALKSVQKSVTFPASVVAYREGGLDEATRKKLRDGMIGASKKERSRELMTMWKLTDFEDPPADYARTLEGVVKAYPPPKGNDKAAP